MLCFGLFVLVNGFVICFREHLATIKAGATVFPIFDAHVGQLEFIHQEQAAYLGPTYLNFRKVKLLGALFAQIKSFQQMRFEPGDQRAFQYVLGIGQVLKECLVLFLSFF